MEYDFDKYEFWNDRIFKVPCGMHVRDQLWTYNVTMLGSLSYMGKTYDIETGNPAVNGNMDKCSGCELAIFTMHGYKHNLNQCEAQSTDEPFDFENSLNKISMDYDIAFYAERLRRYGENWHCLCLHQDRDKLVTRYDPDDCMRYSRNGCTRDYCVIRKKSRDITLVNIYYDLRHSFGKGTLFIDERWERSLKFFQHPVAKDLAEEFMKIIQKEQPEKLNPRISTKKPRNLMDDLAKARDGKKFNQHEYEGDFNTMQGLNRRVKAASHIGIKKRNEEKRRLRLERRRARIAAEEKAKLIKQISLF